MKPDYESSTRRTEATLPPERWLAIRSALEHRDEIRRQAWQGRAGATLKWKLAARAFRFGLIGSGLMGRGKRNIQKTRLREFEIHDPRLPAAFDGYRVLHMSDLHLDPVENTGEHLWPVIAGIDADICVMTGDYRFRLRGDAEFAPKAIGQLVRRINMPDGVYATLGNHDTVKMVAPLAAHGVRVLGNETLSLTRGTEMIHLTGLDDVHNYYTPDARRALDHAPDGYRIVLVHSPELAAPAAEAGIALYLTGHTHAGQVCLPGGRAIIRNLRRHRELAAGQWQLDGMAGYTSAGLGASVVPVRFNCPPEIAVITLRRDR